MLIILFIGRKYYDAVVREDLLWPILSVENVLESVADERVDVFSFPVFSPVQEC